MTRSERQALAIQKWKDHKCRGTIVAATGVGKTKTALDAIERVIAKNPTVKITVVVPTQILQNQWIEKLDERGLVFNITVLVLNTAAKHPFYCNMLVIDEVHRAASEELHKMFLNCKPVFVLGLTATYERLDGREKIILDKFCPVIDEISLDEAEKNGWVSPYKEYKVMIDVDLTEYNKANKLFLEHFSFFNFDWKNAMSCVQNQIFRKNYANLIGTTEKEVAARAFAWNRAMQFRKKFIANHPKKIEIAKKILLARKNTKAITFNSSIKQCEAYGFGYVIHSEKKKKENKAILDEFAKCGPGSVLHNSKMAKEGYDCPGIGVVVITGFNSDKTSKIQEIGRAVRFEEGKEAEIFTLVLKGCQDDKWYKKASTGMKFIEVNESELDDVLSGKVLHKTTKIQDEFTGFRF